MRAALLLTPCINASAGKAKIRLRQESLLKIMQPPVLFIHERKKSYQRKGLNVG